MPFRVDLNKTSYEVTAAGFAVLLPPKVPKEIFPYKQSVSQVVPDKQTTNLFQYLTSSALTTQRYLSVVASERESALETLVV